MSRQLSKFVDSFKTGDDHDNAFTSRFTRILTGKSSIDSEDQVGRRSSNKPKKHPTKVVRQGGDPLDLVSRSKKKHKQGSVEEDLNEERRTSNIQEKMRALYLQASTEKDLQEIETKKVLDGWPKWRHVCRIITSHWVFKVLVSLAIIIQSTMVFFSLREDIDGHIFLGVFSVEFVLRAVSTTRWDCWMGLDGLCLAAQIVASACSIAGGPPVRFLHTLQVLRLVRLLRFTQWGTMPRVERILFSAFKHEGWMNFLSVVLFVAFAWFLCATILKTTFDLFKPGDSCYEEAQEHFSTMHSSFFIVLQLSTQGLRWDTAILGCLVHMRGTFIYACVLLLLILFLTFYFGNFVLSIFTRQIMSIAEADDKGVLERENAMAWRHRNELRKVFEPSGEDTSGSINSAALQVRLDDAQDVLEVLGLNSSQVLFLHESLKGSDGEVEIDELMFSILKMTGSSKSVDILSIDHGQKRLLCEIEDLNGQLQKDRQGLTEFVDSVLNDGKDLALNLNTLKMKMHRARDSLLDQIEEEKRVREDHRKQIEDSELLSNIRYERKKQEKRRELEEHLKTMQRRVAVLKQSKLMNKACSGAVVNNVALHRAVRSRLDQQLKPWLGARLAQTSAKGGRRP
mmetsp:Transcript_92423/g.232455  ORF Transcript_92423/g.232455 Transcript_92423/m.232455 type:complete len:625 (-) Transcript_92423:45-1919(-)